MSFRKIRLAIASLVLCCNLLLAQQYNPVANPNSVAQSGKARFTVLTDRVIRLEYSNDSNFVDQASLTFVNRKLPMPEYGKSEKDGWLIIQTKYCTLHYLENSGPFTAHNLYIEYRDKQHSFTWKPGLKDNKNLKGTTRTLDGVSGKFSFYSL
jgi:hypothetical protein